MEMSIQYSISTLSSSVCGGELVIASVSSADVLAIGATVVMAVATVGIWRSSHLAHQLAIGETMPRLNFRPFRKDQPNWLVENVGKGVALDVLIAHETREGKIETPIRNYSALRPGDRYTLCWRIHPHKFIAQYTDAYGQKYTASCVSSVNSIRKGATHGWSPEEARALWKMIVKGEVEVQEHRQQSRSSEDEPQGDPARRA